MDFVMICYARLISAYTQMSVEINTGGKLSKIICNPFEPGHIATGGEKNNLKIWNFLDCKTPIFIAENVEKDSPVWVADIKFRADRNIVTCTRHHQIQVYDPRTQMHPVIDIEYGRFPLLCLSLPHNERQVIAGSSGGKMVLFDLRTKSVIHVFEGFSGSIMSVQCHPSLPLVASCGLDRFLRIHDLCKQKLLKEIYLMAKLNCLLMRSAVAEKDVEERVDLNLFTESENSWLDIVKNAQKENN